MKELSWEGINLTEVISSTNEFTVVADNALIDKTFVVLKKYWGKDKIIIKYKANKICLRIYRKDWNGRSRY